MKATAIPSHEESFKTSGVDSSGKSHTLKPFEAAIPNSTETVGMIECTVANGDESFFYKTEHAKERIALHFTAGYLKGDIATLTKPANHVSVPFVVARDGSIYNLWTSSYWSYHLGSGTQGGNEAMSKSSVAIEISNIGPVKANGSNLVTTYSNTDVYCSMAEAEFYTKVASYRGEQYFATFTSQQYESVIKLVRFLTAKYDIPRVFIAEPERYNVFSGVAGFKGITSHVNYRSDKWDIGPAFDWNRVIAGVQAG